MNHEAKFDARFLRAAVEDDQRFVFDCLDVHAEIDSTNRFLLSNPPTRTGALRLCVAEWQSAGRGRLDRRWISPPGSGICLSAGWVFAAAPRDFSTLSLAAGAATAAAIQAHCNIEVRLKWPNDIVWDSRKLGGVLLESRVEAQGRCNVVAGIGLNVDLPEELHERVSDWHLGATDLRTAGAGRIPGRNRLAAGLAQELGAMFASFEREGAETWLRHWQRLDYLRGRAIRVVSDTDSFDGVAAGIDADGALLVTTGENQTCRVVAGDASVRHP